MRNREKDKRARVTDLLSGKGLKYTILLSVGVHFGIWGILGFPKDGNSAVGVGDLRPGLSKITITRTVKDLPQAPSIEAPVEKPAAPAGLTVQGDFGLIPLPVPDADADAATISDLYVDPNANVRLDPNVIVVDPDVDPLKPVEDPWANVTITEYSEPPVLIKEARPVYPDIARQSGFEGDVCLLVYIDEEGAVRKATVTASPGLPALDEAAVDAAMKCRFKPARQQERPVGVWYSLVMQFRL